MKEEEGAHAGTGGTELYAVTYVMINCSPTLTATNTYRTYAPMVLLHQIDRALDSNQQQNKRPPKETILNGRE